MNQRKKPNRPIVVQNSEAYQRLLDIAAQADASEGIRQGLEDARKGRTRPAEEFFREFAAAHSLVG
jgi:predicted transcriptional regulator